MTALRKGHRDPIARAFIARYVGQHGRGPSYMEIGAAVGITSSNSMKKLVERMCARGELVRMPGRTRRFVTVPELLEASHATRG